MSVGRGRSTNQPSRRTAEPQPVLEPTGPRLRYPAPAPPPPPRARPKAAGWATISDFGPRYDDCRWSSTETRCMRKIDM